jgi:YHS domain-containing protein
MITRAFLVTAGVLVFFTAAEARQHPGHPGAAAGAPDLAQLAECSHAQPAVTGIIDAAVKRIEDARLTNSAAAMRDAADDLQSSLVDVRSQLEPCAQLESAASPVASPTMPASPAASAAATPVSKVPAPAAGHAAAPAIDPHAGHVMPGAPQTAAPAVAPVAAPRAPSAAKKPARADPHAVHVMPAPPSPAAAKPAAAVDAHAGHGTPETAAANAPEPSATEALTKPDNPAARLAELTCRPRVDPDTAPRATYLGKAYYFCTTADRDAFLKAPAKYLQQ